MGRASIIAAKGAILLLISACAQDVYDKIELMPSPIIYTQTKIDPFSDVTPENFSELTSLFYATDRMPSGPQEPHAFYSSRRGYLLRTGFADVKISPPIETLQELRRVSLSRDRSERYSLQVSQVRETGIMPFSVTRYLENAPSRSEMEAAGRRFAKQINDHLVKGDNRDVFIYVHGYNVNFSYSTLVSKEIQHFMGYKGAFISYNWTATPSRFAYFRDQESVMATRRNLRSLIEYLSENTNARRIHLIGFSAGARLAFETVYQIALQSERKPRLGRLIMIASEMDRANFLQAFEDKLLDAVTGVTIYQTRTDSALAISRFLFGRERLGQASDEGDILPAVQAGLLELNNLQIIDATNAEGASAGNGHQYFRASPWVSSDLFLTLLMDREPVERGLVRAQDEAVWRFPPNYPQILETLAAGN